VLGAGALQVVGLKTITTKNLGMDFYRMSKLVLLPVKKKNNKPNHNKHKKPLNIYDKLCLCCGAMHGTQRVVRQCWLGGKTHLKASELYD